MSYEEVKTLRLTHRQVADLIQGEIEKIVQHPVPCRYMHEDFDVWEIGFRGYRMPLAELFHLFDVIDAEEDVRKNSVPDEVGMDVNGIGSDASRILLENALGLCWDRELSNREYLWLIDVQPPEKKEEARLFLYKNIIVNLDMLKTKDEAIEYIEEKGGNYSALQEFDEKFSPSYDKELFWHYPIVTENLFSGTYFLLVKEGVLALPYNIIDEDNMEVFCLDDAELCGVESLDMYIEEWQSHSDELFGAMGAMRRLMQAEEARQAGQSDESTY